MKLTRRGAPRLQLSGEEAGLLADVLREARGVIGSTIRGNDVTERLYPGGYADEKQACAFRELTESGLRDDRVARLDCCLADLAEPDDAEVAALVLVHVGGEDGDRWIRVLNDLRLVFGTRLGITEDSDYDRSDPEMALYYWLTALQDSVVRALMR